MIGRGTDWPTPDSGAGPVRPGTIGVDVMADNGRCPLPQAGRTRGCCRGHRTTHHTSTQDGKTAGWLPQLRRIGAPHLRGSCPQSLVAAAWRRIAATHDLIAVTPAAETGVVAHPGS